MASSEKLILWHAHSFPAVFPPHRRTSQIGLQRLEDLLGNNSRPGSVRVQLVGEVLVSKP